MKKNKIIVHCMVKNEENFIWYALQSVLPFVEKIMVWDTGSEDKTVKIIESIKSPKIELKIIGNVDKDSFTSARNEMLKNTDKQKYDWLMILDGDEIWPSNSFKKIKSFIDSHPGTQAIFLNTMNSVGDIYHKQTQSAGHYNIKGKSGHLSVRFINLKNVPNLRVDLPHGQQGFFSDKTLIQELPNVDYVDTYYLHTTHLERSSLDKSTLKRSIKRKFELGERVPLDQLPKIIFAKHSSLVPDVSKHMNFIVFLQCLALTIPRRIKRLFISPTEGY
ncbi:TPA: hypothetical protein DEP81_01910 [Candidatus Woesebacteria bacterium]|nr:hypothetical protein [Candidatus Woesebacteria bacterium]